MRGGKVRGSSFVWQTKSAADGLVSSQTDPCQLLSVPHLNILHLLTFLSLDPPNVTVTSSSTDPVVEGDDSVSLKCEVDANPEAEITWRKDGDRRVLGNFPVLDIGVVSRTDTGTYSCTATNELGESPPGYVEVETYCEYRQSWI